MARIAFDNEKNYGLEDFIRYVKSYEPHRVNLFITESGAVILRRAVESDSIASATISGLTHQQITRVVEAFGNDNRVFRVKEFEWDEERAQRPPR